MSNYISSIVVTSEYLIYYNRFWIRIGRMRIRIHKNLMNADPDLDPGQQNHQIDFNPFFQVKKKKYFQICTLEISYYSRFRLKKYISNEKKCIHGPTSLIIIHSFNFHYPWLFIYFVQIELWNCNSEKYARPKTYILYFIFMKFYVQAL